MDMQIQFAVVVGILGILLGCLAGVFCAGLTGGFFWIFVFGDNPWPAYAQFIIMLPAIAGFLFLF